MSWFYQPKTPVPTKHNGTMYLTRWLGTYTLHAPDGTFQHGDYMDGLWREVIRHVWKTRFKPRRVLVLGVAMGSTFNILRRVWPDVAIVGVDWEPALHELGKKLGIYRPDARIEFVEGDALDVVPRLAGTFDLVIVDLFNGGEMTDAAIHPRLQDAVTSCLAPEAWVGVNFFRHKRLGKLEGWTARLGEPVLLRYVQNWTGIYHQKPKPST